MSAQERLEYMDNQRTQMLTELIQKEKTMQRNYLEQATTSGMIKPYVPPAQAKHPSLVETVGLPQHMTQTQEDPVLAMTTSISKNMWTSNPGYLQRDGLHMTSSYKKDFVYDQEELEYLKSLGYLDKTHSRRRDNFVRYVEAAAKTKVLMKGSGAPQS